MAEMVKVVVDAMGGDNAPVEPVKAAVEAVKQETLKKMMLFSSNGKGTLNQPSQDELVKAVVQEVLRELGRK